MCYAFSDCIVTSLGINEDNDIKCDLSADIPIIGNCVYDSIIHAAGDISEVNAMQVNFNGTKNLCSALEKCPPKTFVFISSVAVYGIVTGEDIDESTPLCPTSQYGMSKLLAEIFLRDWCAEHSVTLTILRPPMILGTGMKGTLRAMVNGIDHGTYFHIKGNTACRSIVHALDVAKVAKLIAPIGGIYNITDGVNPSVEKLAEALACRIGGKSIFSMPYRLVKFAAKIGDALGGKFPISTEKFTKLTTTLTFNSDKLQQTINYTPIDVCDYLHNHNYDENDI